MEKIPLPSKIEITAGSKVNESIISIQPCFPGYGTTLGNALRRVLLSSLPGAAVTAFKIKGASHEFSALPNVKEDLVEVALNLKQLRLKVFSEEPVKIYLKASGEKRVTAKEIKATSDVEVVNTDLVIATLTDKNAELEIEMLVTQGRGYVPTEAKEKDNIESDMILIDSIFTPVKNVGIKISNIRVGQMTNYEDLILTIETDGSITPNEALEKSNQILIDHFNFIDQQAAGDFVPSAKLSSDAEVSTEETTETDQAATEDDKEAKKEKKVKKAKKKADK
ncbi:MAG: DNA-directed RNA polymerase subunit alpha [Patescibacteria group bacterium]|nr:DNA-directed RNA polymerase subunit alpha [Patescibacteria group bacterium]